MSMSLKERMDGLRSKGNGKLTTGAELEKCNGVSPVHLPSSTDDPAPATANDPGDEEDDEGRDYGATDAQRSQITLDIPLAEPPANSNDSLAHLDLRLDRGQSNGLRR